MILSLISRLALVMNRWCASMIIISQLPQLTRVRHRRCARWTVSELGSQGPVSTGQSSVRFCRQHGVVLEERTNEGSKRSRHGKISRQFLKPVCKSLYAWRVGCEFQVIGRPLWTATTTVNLASCSLLLPRSERVLALQIARLSAWRDV